jgi:hypothetical protein
MFAVYYGGLLAPNCGEELPGVSTNMITITIRETLGSITKNTLVESINIYFGRLHETFPDVDSLPKYIYIVLDVIGSNI